VPEHYGWLQQDVQARPDDAHEVGAAPPAGRA